jgi:hypothetical protein
MVSFTESGAGAGPDSSAFVRLTDGSPAIRIAKGQAGGISPDGTHMLLTDEDRQALKVVPIGAGDVRRLDTGSPKTIGPTAVWTPDGTRIVFSAREGVAGPACSSAAGGVRTLTPEGAAWNGGAIIVSTDSRYVLARERGKVVRYPIDGGKPLPLDGLIAGDQPLRYSGDGRSLWVLGGERPPMRIFQLDVATGRRTLSREIVTTDPAGLVSGYLRMLISADGKSYVYGYARTLSDLYLVDGVR